MNIVVAVDFDEATDSVIETGRSLATAFSARLWLVHVAPPDPEFVGYQAGPQTVRDQVASELRNEHRDLQRHAERLRDVGIDATALLVQGPTIATLLAEAKKLAADHIVIGSHGQGVVMQALLGSVSTGVIRDATCPVTVVRSQT